MPGGVECGELYFLGSLTPLESTLGSGMVETGLWSACQGRVGCLQADSLGAVLRTLDWGFRRSGKRDMSMTLERAELSGGDCGCFLCSSSLFTSQWFMA